MLVSGLFCWVRYICGDVAIHITGTWTYQYSVAPDAPDALVFEIAM